MIMPSDKEYKSTKQIMLGQKTINPDFKELADWIDKTYDVRTINIIYDTFIAARRKQSRLRVCFEFESESSKFRDDTRINFDTDMQTAIATKFKEILSMKNGLTGFFRSSRYVTDNILIVFSAFEPVARLEANLKIPQEKVKELQKDLDNPDLWKISSFGATTFFLFTDNQVRKYEGSKIKKDWTDKYFELLERYDEFKYFKRKDFSIHLDSKENFDKNYESNWYYYYK
ncbi:MAG TPA: hypothetical protein VIT44_05625 [Cyclobacteriaceae bacterium]